MLLLSCSCTTEIRLLLHVIVFLMLHSLLLHGPSAPQDFISLEIPDPIHATVAHPIATLHVRG